MPRVTRIWTACVQKRRDGVVHLRFIAKVEGHGAGASTLRHQGGGQTLRPIEMTVGMDDDMDAPGRQGLANGHADAAAAAGDQRPPLPARFNAHS